MIYKILAHIIHRRRPLLLAVVVLAVIALAALANRQPPSLSELEAVRATIYPQNQGVKQ